MKFKQGDIIAIPLLHNLGYAYAKIILPHEFIKCDEQIMLKVFDYRSESIVKDIEVTTNQDFFINPLLLAGTPRLRGGNKCTIIGNTNLKEEDFVIPDFKEHPKIYEECRKFTNESEMSAMWFIAKNLQVIWNEKYDYNAVRHLEMWGNTGYDLQIVRITMEFLRKDGKIITDYFPELLLDSKNSSDYMFEEWKKYVYFLVKSSVPYPQIPKEIRGRAIE